MNLPTSQPKTTRVMLDLETLGPRPGSAILAIGAVKFADGEIVAEFYEPISLTSCVECGLTIDPATIAWWMEQADEARRAAFREDARPLRWALERFSAWLGRPPLELWGNGAAFDNALLAEAYHRAGMPLPWSYRQDRCYRTVAAHSEVTIPDDDGTKHHALHDARWQARRLMAIEAASVSQLPVASCQLPEMADEPPRVVADQVALALGEIYPRYAVPNDPASLAPVCRYLIGTPLPGQGVEVFAEYEDGSLQRCAHLSEHLVNEWVNGGHGHWEPVGMGAQLLLRQQRELNQLNQEQSA